MDRKSKEWEEKRRQNIEKMNEEMERIAEYERGQRADGDGTNRNFLHDPRRSGPAPDTDRKEGSRRHVRNWGGLDFDNVKTGAELEKEWTSRRPGPKGSMDMTMSMTGRERAEYLRWKKEREQIDEERLARHRNATGQWRREWDAQKTDSMFKEDPYAAAAEGVTPEQGSRRARGRNSRAEPRGRASDESKRPPKAPVFGDFLAQGRTQGPRGDRGRGRGGRGQKPCYSMHDNRWEGEKEEEDKEKEDKTKRGEEKPKKKEKEKEEEKSKPPAVQKVVEKNADEEDDDEEWEDASDGEDEGVEEGSDSEHDEKKDKGKEKPTKGRGSSSSSPAHRSRPTSAGSPKEQRTPRPKVHIPPPTVQESPEGGKPLSPFSPLDSHRPVSDWGEEMEMLSPRSSMGGESPLKPPSVEDSPPQKKEPEEKEEMVEEEEQQERQAASSNEPEPQKPEETASDISSPSDKTDAQKTVIVSEPEPEPEPELEPEPVPADPPAAPPSDPAPSEAAVTMDQDAPAAPPPADTLDPPPSSAPPEAEQSASEPAGGADDDTTAAGTEAAPSAETGESSESSETTPSG